FYLYMDDSHGMTWTGPNGTGYVMSQLKEYPKKLFLACSTNKAFAAAGGVLVYPDEESKRKVQHCGKTLIFSGPIQPPMLGAAIASAKIHLSPEITTLQNKLMDKIDYFNNKARALNL